MDAVVVASGGVGLFALLLLLLVYVDVHKMRKEQSDYLDAILARLGQQLGSESERRPTTRRQ